MGFINIGGGSSTPTWAETLAEGASAGGTSPVMSTTTILFGSSSEQSLGDNGGDLQATNTSGSFIVAAQSGTDTTTFTVGNNGLATLIKSGLASASKIVFNVSTTAPTMVFTTDTAGAAKTHTFAFTTPTDNRTVTFQNASGTVAYTSDLTSDGMFDAANASGTWAVTSYSLGGNTTQVQGANTFAITSTAVNAFSVDGNTFNVDASNNKIGIGIASISTVATLHLQGDGINNVFRVRKDGTASSLSVRNTGEVAIGSHNATAVGSYDVHTFGSVVSSAGTNGNAATITINSTPNPSTQLRQSMLAGTTSIGHYIALNSTTNDTKGVFVQGRPGNVALTANYYSTAGFTTTAPVTFRHYYAQSEQLGGITPQNTNEYGAYFDIYGSTGSSYGGFFRARSNAASVTNYAGWFEATGGLNNRAIVTNGGNIGFGTTTPSSACLLQLVSTTQGLGVMTMTADQADAISAINGLIVYVTDTNSGTGGSFSAVGFWGYEAGSWVKL